jgi:hypothetical protein
MTLTDRAIRSLKPRATGQHERYDHIVPSLELRVNSSSKSWVLLYRERLPDTSGDFTSGMRKKRWPLGMIAGFPPWMMSGNAMNNIAEGE